MKFLLLLQVLVLSCVCQQFVDEIGCQYDLSGLEDVIPVEFDVKGEVSIFSYDGDAVEGLCPGVTLHFESSLPCSDEKDMNSSFLVHVACDSTSELRIPQDMETSCTNVAQLWSKFACASNVDDIAFATISASPSRSAIASILPASISPSASASSAASPSPSPSPSTSFISYPSVNPSTSASATSTFYPTVSPSASYIPTEACEAFPIKGLDMGETVTVYGSTVGKPSAPQSSCVTSLAGVAWYVITPGFNANVSVSTCGPYTDFNTEIGVFSGNCNSPNCLYGASYASSSCSGGGASLNWVATQDQYYVSVSSPISNEQGNFQITFSSTKGSDPSCINAIPIPGPYLNPFVTEGSSDVGNSTMTTCGLSTNSRAVWYQINPQIGAPLTISTCKQYTDFDTRIAVFSGTCSNLYCNLVSTNNCTTSYSGVTASEVYFIPTNSSYYVAVYGVGSDSGYYQLSFSQTTPQIDTPCSTAIPITLTRNIILQGTTVGALDFTPNEKMCGPETGATVWFQINNPSYKGQVTFSTCSNTQFDTYLFLYEGACNSLSCKLYNDDACSAQSSISTSLAAGTYYVAVAGYAGSTGSFQLLVSVV